MSNPFDEFEKYRNLFDATRHIQQLEALTKPYREIENLLTSPHGGVFNLADQYKAFDHLTTAPEIAGLASHIIHDGLTLKSAVDTIANAANLYPHDAAIATALVSSTTPFSYLV